MTANLTVPSRAALLAGIRAAGVTLSPKAETEAPPKAAPAAEDPATDEEETAVAAEDTPTEEENPPPPPPEDDDEEEDSPVAAKAAKAERKRIAAILTAPQAEGRGTLAAHFAFATDMPAAAACAALSASPKSTAGTLAAAMGSTPNTPIGAAAPDENPVLSGFAAATQRRYGTVNKEPGK